MGKVAHILLTAVSKTLGIAPFAWAASLRNK